MRGSVTGGDTPFTLERDLRGAWAEAIDEESLAGISLRATKKHWVGLREIRPLRPGYRLSRKAALDAVRRQRCSSSERLASGC